MYIQTSIFPMYALLFPVILEQLQMLTTDSQSPLKICICVTLNISIFIKTIEFQSDHCQTYSWQDIHYWISGTWSSKSATKTVKKSVHHQKRRKSIPVKIRQANKQVLHWKTESVKIYIAPLQGVYSQVLRINAYYNPYNNNYLTNSAKSENNTRRIALK